MATNVKILHADTAAAFGKQIGHVVAVHDDYVTDLIKEGKVESTDEPVTTEDVEPAAESEGKPGANRTIKTDKDADTKLEK